MSTYLIWRDLDLARDILPYIEEEFGPAQGVLHFAPDSVSEELTQEHSAEVVMRHIELPWEAGLVNVYRSKGKTDVQRSAKGTPVLIAVRGYPTKDTTSLRIFATTRSGRKQKKRPGPSPSMSFELPRKGLP